MIDRRVWGEVLAGRKALIRLAMKNWLIEEKQ
jgi:hypothetical protein